MMDYAEYLLRLSVIWSVLIAYYYLALHRKAPFAFRRAYLIATILAGLAIPLLPALIFGSRAIVLEPVRATFRAVLDLRGAPGVTDGGWSVSVPSLLYFIGLAAFLARSLVQGWLVWRWKRGGVSGEYTGFPLVTGPAIPTPFTIYGYIFLPASLVDTDLGRTALLHESAHLRQRHHYDAFALEVLCLLLWFHPGAWLLRRMLRDVHEYQADAAVVETIPRKTYGMQLLQASQTPFAALGLFSSPIKNRINVLTSSASRRFHFVQALLPLLLLGVLSFTCSDLLAQVDTQRARHVSAGGSPILTTLPDGATREEIMRAFLVEVYGEIKYPKAARSSRTEGLVFLSMSIDPDGQCRNYETRYQSKLETFGGANIIVVGYGAGKATGGKNAPAALEKEVVRMVEHLNKTGFKYEDSGYPGVPVTYGLTFKFVLE
ncbi:M56 family metallopeptidase [Neolewinella antarctica]|uniref:Peptidase M56 domain-containing protein n=1 Tax=Neolewinella antarctica TaxID=442734 RepID=A0ABX0XBE4_9BACT|nr:M56 family metallopeptidase [Neolewinella antarctica]NJC26591.1 hypothetical protein [Neolewinella antarctica]